MHGREREAAYRHTTFWVDHPSGGFGIRVGERCAQLDALLRQHGVTTWAYVTASNPRSQQLSDVVNSARHANLVRYVHRVNHPTFSGKGKSDAGDWPPEESLLILGLGEDAALRLGSMLDQNAIVVGRLGEPAELSWCDRWGDSDDPRPLTQPLSGPDHP